MIYLWVPLLKYQYQVLVHHFWVMFNLLYEYRIILDAYYTWNDMTWHINSYSNIPMIVHIRVCVMVCFLIIDIWITHTHMWRNAFSSNPCLAIAIFTIIMDAFLSYWYGRIDYYVEARVPNLIVHLLVYMECESWTIQRHVWNPMTYLDVIPWTCMT